MFSYFKIKVKSKLKNLKHTYIKTFYPIYLLNYIYNQIKYSTKFLLYKKTDDIIFSNF